MRAWLLMMMCGIAGGTFAQGDTIYRCDEGGGRVLYSNTPCPGGRVVPLVESKPDPAARERLQRDLEAFEKRQSARDAAIARERERKEDARQRSMPAPQEEQPQSYGLAYGYYGYYGYYPPYYPPQVRPPVKPRPRPHRSASFLPVR